MPWEERGGRRYYYRKVRKGGRVFSVYVGGGLMGQLAEHRDTEARGRRLLSRLELREALERSDRIDGKLDEAWRVVERAAAGALEAAGYHKHKRQWRLKRDAKAG